MARHTLHRAACLLLFITVIWAEKEQTRWSRQISSYTADISDWVPLPGPVEQNVTPTKRQAIAEPRILSEPFPGFTRPAGFNHGGFNQDPFPSRAFFNSPANKQLYLHSLPAVPSAPQNFLSEQGFGQGIRFGLSQPNFPLNQAFVSPQLNLDNIPQINSKPQQLSLNPQIKFENVPKTGQSLKPQQSYITQTPMLKPELPKVFEGYHVQNVSNDFNSKRPQSLQKLKYDGIKTETDAKSKPKVEREEVQLLYVPLESLNSGQFNFRNPVGTPQIIDTDLLSQIQRQVPINKPVVDFHKQLTQPIENLIPRQEFLANFNSQSSTFDQIPKFSTVSSPFPNTSPSTVKPKKLKAHQPPLAIFLTQEARKNQQVKVGDVLYSLKNADTIAVLDAVNPQTAPKVFIGPSSLSPPENYVKFELPYLSNIENSEKKLRQLPFFVAPLSYNTPQGFAKIPFPSPHVGSVVINSQIAKSVPTTPSSEVPPSFYTYNQTPQKTDQNIATQKPRINYYSTTSPNVKDSVKYEPNFYSFEQQTVNPLRVQKEETGAKANSYFLSNIGNRYNPSNFVNFPSSPHFQTPELIQTYTNLPTARIISTQKPTTSTTTTSTTTTTTTTAKPSTYSSQLLQTHNPYSINQAFHFSTPIDYQNFFDEYKENYSSPNKVPPPQQQATTNIPSPNPEPISHEKDKTKIKYSHGTPNYLQGYTPEIQYESEVQNTRFTNFNTNQEIPKNQATYEYREINNPVIQNGDNKPSNAVIPSRDLNEQTESELILSQGNLQNNSLSTTSENSIPLTGPTNNYNQYDTSFDTGETEQSIQSSSSTTTTTTRRPPLRTRGRPRYTVKPDTGEYTTKTILTRRPLRERRPLASRTRYEPNKITTEKVVQNLPETIESTTKYIRTKTRGRVHYKPSDADELHEKRLKSQNSKENDLAYQRDVLHQNYPVTLMERMSTVDIEAITEPTIRAASSSVNHSDDTENAYSYEKFSVTEHPVETENSADLQDETNTSIKDTYVPNVQSTRNDETIYQIKSSIGPGDADLRYEEIKDNYTKHEQTTPLGNTELLEVTTPDSIDSITEGNEQRFSATDKYDFVKEEEITTQQNIENSNIAVDEENEQSNQEENIVQTTPSYNRVRVRPGVIRQYHPASTEATRVKVNRRRPGQAITYRPAFDRRRTTMRIEEIEADLKTKQIHSRPEFQDYRHPVYKPEPSTEPTITTSSTQESTKRGPYRRRRPSYTTSPTETPTTQKLYEIKNRFRGRRPTEKPTAKTEVQTETTTSVSRDTIIKYNNRPRLSERFNNNPVPEETQDQDLNFSIRRPNYAAPESDRWSPKISTDSFKPYNPNDIIDEDKVSNLEQQSPNEHELDIITAKNEYDNILISVTPATNNRINKKVPDIPPTLEALVEQSRITKGEGGDTMSTFESMLEEVMKNLEEQDEDEYTKNVMKHKGGEIGEIPPEKIIMSEDSYSKTTTPFQEATTTMATSEEVDQLTEKEKDRKTRRRGFWKKVKVRPATETIEVAESQHYPNTVNRVGQPINLSKTSHDKTDKYDKSRLVVTTYKPTYQFIKELFENDNEQMEITPHIDIPKINVKAVNQTKTFMDQSQKITGAYKTKESTEKFNPGEMDLGTGTPDPTYSDNTYYSTATETVTSTEAHTTVDRSDGFSLMDYFFGITSSDSDINVKVKNETKRDQNDALKIYPKTDEVVTTEQPKSKLTTETTYMPEEIATTKFNEEERREDEIDNNFDSDKVPTVPPQTQIETSSISSFMDSLKVVSTSMSTEISHETEICFRGKCIKTRKPTS